MSILTKKIKESEYTEDQKVFDIEFINGKEFIIIGKSTSIENGVVIIEITYEDKQTFLKRVCVACKWKNQVKKFNLKHNGHVKRNQI